MRRLSPALLVAVLLAGCGSSKPAATTTEPGSSRVIPGPSPTSSPDAQAQSEIDADKVGRDLVRKAKAGDRSGAAAAQRQLDALAAAQPSSTPSTDKDPFQRELDDLAFHQKPLYIEQEIATEGSHTLLVAVDQPVFCLNTVDVRLGAARAVYGPIEQRLQAAGIKDFVFRLVPAADPDKGPLLALGRGGTLALTSAGRNC